MFVLKKSESRSHSIEKDRLEIYWNGNKLARIDCITRFCNSGIFLLVTGALLTTCIGNHLSTSYKDEVWKRDIDLKNYMEKTKKMESILEDVMLSIDRRVGEMRNLHHHLENRDVSRFESYYPDYIKEKDNWNNFIKNRKHKIKLHFNENFSKYFSHGTSEYNHNIPLSIQDAFRALHYSIKKFKSCLKSDCKRDPVGTKLLEIKVHNHYVNLRYTTDCYISKLSEAYFKFIEVGNVPHFDIKECFEDNEFLNPFPLQVM